VKATLLLEDGTVFYGRGFGARADSVGEVVFNTGMTGYQEVITDPSYCAQIVVMTYPLIGNYGINREDFEAPRPFIRGFVVRDLEDVPSNWRAEFTVAEYLEEHGIPGISGIDTRQLTRRLRSFGTMKGIISTTGKPLAELAELLEKTPLPSNQVELVSDHAVYRSPGRKERIVLVDFGSKLGILGDMTARGMDVVVVPYNCTAEQIRLLRPDGIVLSNGPGDPKDVPHAVDTIRELIGEFPIFGICLGHQLLALACGADTEKLKFGHRGSNHPVKDLRTGRCYITSQNHGYTVRESSLAGTGLVVTHINNNDGTVEGLKHETYPAFSVQYHPEAAPGPFDSSILFDEFTDMIRKWKNDHPVPPRQAQFAARAEQSRQKGTLIHAKK